MGARGMAKAGRPSPDTLVLVDRVSLRSCRPRGDGVRLDRHRGGAPALGRLQIAHNLAGGNGKPGHHRELDGSYSPVRNPRRVDGSHLTNSRTPLEARTPG